MNEKGFSPIAILVIITVLILVGIIGFMSWSKANSYSAAQNEARQKGVILNSQPSSNTDETANWKTYTNSEVGYSFLYPSDWQISGSGKDVSAEKDNYKLNFFIPPYKTGAIPSTDTYTTKNITINNKQYIGTIFWKDQNNKVLDFETVDIAKGLEIHFYYKDQIYSDQYSAIFDQILSTFKFTN